MKKLLLALLIFAVTGSVTAQDLSTLGVENSDTLTIQEAELFNELLAQRRDTFNFLNKKVAFLTGSSGNKIVGKEFYFDNAVVPALERGEKPSIYMVLLKPTEKAASGGYDVLVLSWGRMFTQEQRKEIIKQLGAKKAEE
jgi:hypothetical protein